MVPLVLGFVIAGSRTQSIVLGGDIMLNGITIQQKPFEKIAPIMRPSGAAIANLEIPLTNATKETTSKSAEDVRNRNQFILKADPRFAPLIASAGIDLVSLGNNHCMDYREQGLVQMEAALDKNHVGHAGAGANRSLALNATIYVAADGRRIGLISALAFVGGGALKHCTPATDHSAGIGTLGFGGVIDAKAKAYLAAMFSEARKNCDVLIVGLHWGIERQTTPTSYQVQLGRACIDAGADIVWGNHPHVLQGAELYNGKPILYSMGNLISSKGGATGLIKLVYENGQFGRGQFFPLEISGGRVLPVTGPDARTRVASYAALCKAVQKHYPSKQSAVLIAGPDPKISERRHAKPR